MKKLVKLLVSISLASALPVLAQSSPASATAAASTPATAQKAASKSSTVKKTTTKKAPAKKAKPVKTEEAVTSEDEAKESELSASVSREYKCELGNTITVFANAADPEHIAMRWKTHIWRMVRVPTTTGADRFENRRIGLVWIGIPSKGLLLDSHKGQQLANECKAPDQEAPATAAEQAPAAVPATAPVSTN